VGDTIGVAAPQRGEVVVDLGSGAGRDVFTAAALVGPEGRAIGVDATPEMVHGARETAQIRGLTNVEFRLGEIEHLPVESGSAHVIVSDCVINLSPDKAQVFREAFRVLRAGGRLVLSDVVAERPLLESVREDARAWAACIAGAVGEGDYHTMLRDAGFVDIETVDRGEPSQPPLRAAVIRARKASS
jgi:ubiquinone/menaquinone biosynthesis C-methylase UbiE